MPNIRHGITNAFFTAKASDKYSWSGLMSINDFAIQNNMILTIMKSNPYNVSASKENRLSATNVVKYGIREITNSNNIFCQITFELIRST